MNKLIHAPDEVIKDWKAALDILKEGNRRFVENDLMPRDNHADLASTKDGQKPFAVILSCSDSRTSPEIFFDQKIGDICAPRNGGNIADENVLGAVEFSAGALGIPLVLVVGHNRCGAVYAAYSGKKDFWPNLQTGLDEINSHIKDCPDAEAGMTANVKAQVAKIKELPIVKEKGTMVIGAEYNIETGKVTFYE